MFKAYDIRVKAQKLSSDDKTRLVNAVVKYYSEVLDVTELVICRDARLYVPELAELLMDNALRAGINVLINPLPVSTCQFYYTCMKNRSAGGIMLTASHNPMEYVGLKLMAPDVLTLSMGNGPQGGICAIKQFYDGNLSFKDAESCGKTTVINETENYIDYAMRLAGVKTGDLAGLKVLMEFLSGSAGAELALAFQKAGADLTVRNLVPNGFFPNGDPNPIIESSIAPAREFMKTHGFDIGFCFDGDGDRMDIMDKDGNQIIPGLNMSVIIQDVLSLYGNTKHEYYADVKSVPTAVAVIAENGVNVHTIRNGHSFIKSKLRDNCGKGFFASVEESAHYYVNLPYEDSPEEYAAVESTLYFALLTAKNFKNRPEAYANAIEIQKNIFREREWSMGMQECPELIPDVLESVSAEMGKRGAKFITSMDDGSDLDATLMRFNLPDKIDMQSLKCCENWAQVTQRVSRSEDSLIRWEVVSNNRNLCSELAECIKSVSETIVRCK